MISNTAVTNGVHGLTTDATVYAAGSRPFANKFTNVFFDSYQEDCILKNCAEFEFVNCQWAGGRSGVAFDGLEIVQSNGMRFTNCTFVNCGRHGCNVNEATAINTSFLGCVFDSNSVTSGASVAHGLRFTTGVEKFQVQGCLSGNNYATGGTQGLGIQINASCDNFIITDNNLIGNGTGGLADASSASANKHISANLGYNTSGSEIVTATNVITAAESGTTFFLNSANEFVSTLPAPAQGLEYTFIVTAAPSGAAYTVVTTSSANIMEVLLLDIVGELVYATGRDVVTFADGVSLAGDRLEVVSDGTNWFCKAFSGADGGITVGVT